jgi:hypothetical protein
MRHEHLMVTVDSGIKVRIEEDLDPGETVEAWVADAIDAKLADEEAESSEAIRADSDGVEASDDERKPDGDKTNPDGDTLKIDDSDETTDGYDEGFEYVDDCSI